MYRCFEVQGFYALSGKREFWLFERNCVNGGLNFSAPVNALVIALRPGGNSDLPYCA